MVAYISNAKDSDIEKNDIAAHICIATPISEERDVRVLRSIESLEAVREFWMAHQWFPQSDFEYFVNEVKGHRGVLAPFVILVLNGGRPSTLVAGMVREGPLDWRIGYVRPFRRPVRCILVATGGVLGADSEADRLAAKHALLEALRRGEADLVILNRFGVETPLVKTISDNTPWFSRDPVPVMLSSWTLSVPKTYQEFIASRGKATRKKIRGVTRKFEADLSGRFSIKCYRDEAELNKAISDASSIAAKTYQRRIGVGFYDTPEIRSVLKCWARRGMMRFYILYVGETPTAFWAGVMYGETHLLTHTAYDPDMDHYRPGLYLLLKLIESDCREGTVRTIDYGHGDGYKSHFASHCATQCDVHVFAPTVAGFRLWLTRALVVGTDQAAKAVLLRLNLFDRIRTIWRRAAGPFKLPFAARGANERCSTADHES